MKPASRLNHNHTPPSTTTSTSSSASSLLHLSSRTIRKPSPPTSQPPKLIRPPASSQLPEPLKPHCHRRRRRRRHPRRRRLLHPPGRPAPITATNMLPPPRPSAHPPPPRTPSRRPDTPPPPLRPLVPPSSAHAPPLRLRPAPHRINGIDLKAAEQITRRLLLSPRTTPVYYALPAPPPDTPALVRRFLLSDGFASLHPALDPASPGHTAPARPYGLPPARAARKRAQIANIVAAACAALSCAAATSRPAGPRILDLCGGCGHVGLVLAALLPHARVTVVDANDAALAVARRRARHAGLPNVDARRACVEALGDVRFELAVALHACGGASDVVLAAAAAQPGAAVVVVPCCVGGVVAAKGSVTGSAAGTRVVDPVGGGELQWGQARSEVFRGLLGTGEFARLARAADVGERAEGRDDWRRVAKAMVEQDRALWMEEAGLDVRVVKIRPLDCTPKNDVLVAWPSRGQEGQGKDNVGWDLDEQSNAFIRAAKEGSIMRDLGASEVAKVEAVMNAQVCAEDSKGVYTFPKGAGKRLRKVVHAVAESMGLEHTSEGKGAERCVTVRRTKWWPLFFDYYVGVGGPAIEAVCELFRDKVPEECLAQRQLLRGNSHHVTIIRPSEIKKLPYRLKGEKASLLDAAVSLLKGSEFQTLGLGRVSKETPTAPEPHVWVGAESDVGADTQRPVCDQSSDVNNAYFIVLDWPAANALRQELGLAPADLHITLGFDVKDVHGQVKDHETLLFEEEHDVAPWGEGVSEALSLIR